MDTSALKQQLGPFPTKALEAKHFGRKVFKNRMVVYKSLKYGCLLDGLAFLE